MRNQSFCADDSVSEFVNRYKNMVYRIALSHTPNRSDADDAFQQTFLVYFSKGPVFHEEEHRKAWLIRTALNCCKKISANSWRKKTIPLEDAPEEAFQFVSKEENLVYQAVRALPEKYRTVIFLFYFEGFSAEKIGELLKVKAGTVRVQLMRGRELLRETLKGGYFDEA